MENTFFILIPFISLLCYSVLLFILIFSAQNKLSLRYFYYIIAMFIWSLGSHMMKVNNTSALFWNRVLGVGLIATPVFFYHFTLAFVKDFRKKYILFVSYLITIVLIIGNILGLLIKSVSIQDNSMTYEIGFFAYILAVFGLVIYILAFIKIFSKVYDKEISFKKVRLIIIGVVLSIIGSLFNLFPELGRYPIDIILNTINAICIAYSIYFHGFLETKPFVKRGLTYSLYTLILSSFFIIAIMVFPQLLSKITGNSSFLSLVIVCIVLAIILEPINSLLRQGIFSLFYKKSLHHQEILRKLEKDINNILNLDDLIDEMTLAVNDGVKPKQLFVALCLEDEKIRICKTNKIYDIKDNNPIIQWFLKGNQLLTTDEINENTDFTVLTKAERSLMDNVKLIFPLNYRNKLHGFLVLTEKKDGNGYFKTDIKFIQLLLNKVSIILENVRLYEAARQQAITDGLTKLYNHRYFHETLWSIINNQKYQVFSLVIFDIDLFKFYNDVYGHSAGDRVLNKIAKILIDNTNEADIITRYGGEEFAIILPNTSREEAYKLCEIIRGKIEENFYTTINQNEIVTISGGISTYPINATTSEELIDAADKALYIAKETGRNRIVLSNKNLEGKFIKEYKNVSDIRSNINYAYQSSIYALAAAIDAKDHYTYGHSEKVSKLAIKLAELAKLSEDKIIVLKNAGLIHDIGKIGIPENILTKKGKLTTEEYEIMKKHVDISISIIKHVPNLMELIPAIMSHHERYDGKGYPRGLKGDNIPLEGRILSIVDAYDAMTSDRSYRKALELVYVLNELETHKGTQFDPDLTDLFINLIKQSLS